MKKYSLIFREVLKEIKPSKEQEVHLKRVANKALKLVKGEAKKYKAKAILAGSITRNTWLPDKLEFDIFIMFPEEMKEKRMENLGLRIGKKVVRKLKGTFKIEYAEHPYVSGNVDGIDIDIVPCYELKSLEKIKSAVDRTPFHVRYLEKNFKKVMSNEVRLLKQFLKANEIYGADTKTQGFSGYSCELLIIKYKKFLNLLKEAVKWNPGEIIDIEKYYTKKDFEKLKMMFKNQPLILIDPVDKNRNTAAALSPRNFFLFKKLAKAFLKNPSNKFFFPKEIKPMREEDYIKKLRKRETEIIVLKFEKPDVIEDILWPQLTKFADRVCSILKEYDFKVMKKAVFADEEFCYVLFEFEIWKLPEVEKRVGPIIFDLKDSRNFLEKYKEDTINGPYVEGIRWVVETKRRFLTAKEKLIDSLSKSFEILVAKGIPNYIAEKLAKGFDIFAGSEVILLLKNRKFAIFLKKYFTKEKLI